MGEHWEGGAFLIFIFLLFFFSSHFLCLREGRVLQWEGRALGGVDHWEW